MKSSSTWRARITQTLLPISNLGADCKSSALRCWPREMLTSVLRLACLFVLAAFASCPSFAQNENNGYPEDWTHHHVVFSDPGTLHEASGRGSFDTWYKVVTDPRFAHQRHRRREDPDRDRDRDRDKEKGDKGSQTPPPLDR